MDTTKHINVFVPYLYVDRHGNYFGSNDVHFGTLEEAEAYLEKRSSFVIGGKSGFVENREVFWNGKFWESSTY